MINYPKTRRPRKRNFCFRLQTKFTPKITVLDTGLVSNFSQIYFNNVNVNFGILEIFVAIEGFFQYLDVYVESDSDFFRTELIDDKIIISVDITSKPKRVEGILKISENNFPISLNLNYIKPRSKENENIKVSDFVFSDMDSHLNFKTATIKSIKTKDMSTIVDLINSYKEMSDKFSDLFFSYMKSNQQSFPINLLKTFMKLYSLHEFLEFHPFDSFCPYYSSANDFKISFHHLLQTPCMDESSDEENFDSNNIFCFKNPIDYDTFEEDPNFEQQSNLINDSSSVITQHQESVTNDSIEIQKDVSTMTCEKENQMTIPKGANLAPEINDSSSINSHDSIPNTPEFDEKSNSDVNLPYFEDVNQEGLIEIQKSPNKIQKFQGMHLLHEDNHKSSKQNEINSLRIWNSFQIFAQKRKSLVLTLSFALILFSAFVIMLSILFHQIVSN